MYLPSDICVLLEEMKNYFDLDELSKHFYFVKLVIIHNIKFIPTFMVFCSVKENRQSLICHEAADKNLNHWSALTYLKPQNRSNLDWHFASFSHTIFDLPPEGRQAV